MTKNQKHSKFRDLAEKRTNNALAAIERIGKLSNPYLYEWDDIEVKKIIKALRDATVAIEVKFSSPKASDSKGFKL